MDIVIANLESDSDGVLLGVGNGTFSSVATYSAGTSSQPSLLSLGDMNADGRLDFVTTNSRFSGVSILLGNGDETFCDQYDLFY